MKICLVCLSPQPTLPLFKYALLHKIGFTNAQNYKQYRFPYNLNLFSTFYFATITIFHNIKHPLQFAKKDYYPLTMTMIWALENDFNGFNAKSLIFYDFSFSL